MAPDLKLSNQEVKRLAIKSFQNLMITSLEYEKFARQKDIHKISHCENPKTALELLKEDKGVIFFCGHQANWEILFLEGTSRMPGVAIGKPVKNKYLYSWVLSIRQKFGGTIIAPRNAIKEGLKALKKGKFLGIVGDQGMPDSGFSSPFLGRMAWTSPIAAMLSYRSQRPIIVATTTRVKGKYLIRYSDPIWPDLSKPMDEQIPSLMLKALHVLEKSIIENPDQWLWQHNRWKQQLPGSLPRVLRQDTIAILLSNEIKNLEPILRSFREIYPNEFLSIIANKNHQQMIPSIFEEVIFYENESELFRDDLRYKLVFNFTKIQTIKKHYLKRSAFGVFTKEDLCKLSQKKNIHQFDNILQMINHA